MCHSLLTLRCVLKFCSAAVEMNVCVFLFFVCNAFCIYIILDIHTILGSIIICTITRCLFFWSYVNYVCIRVFGGDQVTKIMDSFRLSDDIPIENKQVGDKQ